MSDTVDVFNQEQIVAALDRVAAAMAGGSAVDAADVTVVLPPPENWAMPEIQPIHVDDVLYAVIQMLDSIPFGGFTEITDRIAGIDMTAQNSIVFPSHDHATVRFPTNENGLGTAQIGYGGNTGMAFSCNPMAGNNIEINPGMVGETAGNVFISNGNNQGIQVVDNGDIEIINGAAVVGTVARISSLGAFTSRSGQFEYSGSALVSVHALYNTPGFYDFFAVSSIGDLVKLSIITTPIEIIMIEINNVGFYVEAGTSINLRPTNGACTVYWSLMRRL